MKTTGQLIEKTTKNSKGIVSLTSNSEIVRNYIETVWNSRALDQIDKFIAVDYQDFSFLPTVPPNPNGLRFWIENTSRAFDHTTTIESIIQEHDQVAVRISFTAKHIGPWRNIHPTSRTVTVKGFRFFQLKDRMIIRHWALIDGEALQTALTGEHHGCELPNVGSETESNNRI